MRLPAALAVLALLVPPGRGGVAVAATAAVPPAPGLAFALALKGDGTVLASGPFLLQVPGGGGPLKIELSRLSVAGARLRGEVSARNDSRVLLAGLALDFVSASSSPRDPGRGAAGPAPLRLREPVPLGDLLPGESTPFLPFELAPVPLGEDVLLTTLLGALSGLAVDAPVAVEGATRPVALDADRSDRLYVATAGVGRVLRLRPLSPETPAEAARPAAPPAGVALRRRDGALYVSTGGRSIEAWIPGRKRSVSIDAGGPAGALRFDAKGTLRAAVENGVVTFDGAKPGSPRRLGPAGSRVASFDTDAHGLVHAVVVEGEARSVAVDGPLGPRPWAPGRGPGDEALAAPLACRFDGEEALWVASAARAPEHAVLVRFPGGGTPRAVLSRLALALLLGREEDAAVPSIVDLAPGTERRVWVLLEDGRLFAARPL